MKVGATTIRSTYCSGPNFGSGARGDSNWTAALVPVFSDPIGEALMRCQKGWPLPQGAPSWMGIRSARLRSASAGVGSLGAYGIVGGTGGFGSPSPSQFG